MTNYKCQICNDNLDRHALLSFVTTAGERPPHKETQTYGCCVSTLTRFVRPPLQRPLTRRRAFCCSLSFTLIDKCRQRTGLAAARRCECVLNVWNCQILAFIAPSASPRLRATASSR